MRIDVQALSDIGLSREHNEDCFGVSTDQHLVVVCDGMGGHNAGEVASRLAVDSILGLFQKLKQNEVTKLCADVNKKIPVNALRIIAAMRLANYHIFSLASRSADQRGMGTTAVVIYFENNTMIAAHVGDSRIYRYSNGHLKQITQDHSWLNELIEDGELNEEDATDFGKKNVITRAIGIGRTTKIDLLIDSIESGDSYLLCSDGLSVPVSDEKLSEILRENIDPQNTVKALIKAAIEEGGPDNITAALASISQVKKGGALLEKIKATIADENQEIQREERIILERVLGKSLAKVPGGKRKAWLRPVIGVVIVFIITVAVIIFLNRPGQDNKLPAEINSESPTEVDQKNLQQGAEIEETNDVIKEQNKGTIYFVGFPSNAIVYLDNDSLGKLSEFWNEGLSVEIKMHKVVIEYEGKSYQYSVNLYEEQEKYIHFR